MSETIVKQPNDSTLLNETVPRVAVKKKAKDLIDARYVIIYDPNTGKPLGAADFFLEHQADISFSKTNPVSATYYEVLPATTNCRVISVTANVTWAVTQPTPLQIKITIDKTVYTATLNNPVSGSDYQLALLYATNAMILVTTFPEQTRSFLLEGRSVKIEVALTWAVTQPTPLTCKVKYAKR